MTEELEITNVTNYTALNVVTPVIPKLPEAQKFFQEDIDLNQFSSKFGLEEFCDCNQNRQPLAQCPHFQNSKPLLNLFKELPYKLGHIDKFDPPNQDDLKYQIFRQISEHKDGKKCRYKPKDPVNGEEPQKRCHFYRDLHKLFEPEFKRLKGPQVAVKRVKEARFLINVSFGLNVTLMLGKLVGVFVSSSMAVLTSMIDTCLDVMSGIILIIAVKIAKKGIERGKYHEAMHSNTTKIKLMYALRLETLGILAFACIMGSIAFQLINKAIEEIVKIVRGEAGKVDMPPFIISTLVFNIIVKCILSIWCRKAMHRTDESEDVLEAYAEDHRNDTLTNLIGLIGAVIGSYAGGWWALTDPVSAIFLDIYIAYNWTTTAYEILQQMAGKRASQDVEAGLLMQLVYCTDIRKIRQIKQFHVHESGANYSVEIVATMDNNMDVATVHSATEVIERAIEEIDRVERCHVVIEAEKK